MHTKWVGLGFLAVLIILSGCLSPPPVENEVVHLHADFAVYLNGQKFDFAQEKYMSTKDGGELSEIVHMHDMDGGLIHVHAADVTLGMFFDSLGMTLTPTCFTTDDGVSYCNDDTHKLTMWVNGKPNTGFDQYVPVDLDRILITYGNETTEQIQAQYDAVTDVACIQSEKCPERGSPSDESSCAGSGTCGVGNIPT